MHTHPTDPATRAAAEHAAALLEQADALIVAAGAGMGVDSGLPDFRGNEGFWRAYPALAQARLDFASIASPAAFREAPELAWGFYGHRLALYRRTVPHAGFGQLQRWGACMHQGLSVFTSNVDGQFQMAGYFAEAVHECHGSIHHLQCLEGCSDAIWPADDFGPDVDESTCRRRTAPPRCPHCGGLARPNILMFNDGDWREARTPCSQRCWCACWAAVRASSQSQSLNMRMLGRARPPQWGQRGGALRRRQVTSSTSGTKSSAGQMASLQPSRHCRWWMEPWHSCTASAL